MNKEQMLHLIWQTSHVEDLFVDDQMQVAGRIYPVDQNTLMTVLLDMTTEAMHAIKDSGGLDMFNLGSAVAMAFQAGIHVGQTLKPLEEEGSDQ